MNCSACSATKNSVTVRSKKPATISPLHRARPGHCLTCSTATRLTGVHAMIYEQASSDGVLIYRGRCTMRARAAASRTRPALFSEWSVKGTCPLQTATSQTKLGRWARRLNLDHNSARSRCPRQRRPSGSVMCSTYPQLNGSTQAVYLTLMRKALTARKGISDMTRINGSKRPVCHRFNGRKGARRRTKSRGRGVTASTLADPVMNDRRRSRYSIPGSRSTLWRRSERKTEFPETSTFEADRVSRAVRLAAQSRQGRLVARLTNRYTGLLGRCRNLSLASGDA